MKILGIPVKDMSMSSTRIRYYTFLKGMDAKRYEDGDEGDILYIQKRSDDATYDIALKAKANGTKIVYDRDDLNEGNPEEQSRMLEVADWITTDTVANSEWIMRLCDKPVTVVQDCLDYDVQPSDRMTIREKVSRVTTYGRHMNIRAMKPYYKKLGLKTSYICDRVVGELSNSKFIKWKLGNFLLRLAAHDVSIVAHCLTHRGYRIPYKGELRVVTAMSIGMPILVSPTPSYVAAVTAAGHGELAIEDPTQTRKKLEMVADVGVRRAISDAFFKYAWENYRPEKSVQILSKVFGSVI